YRDLMRFAAYFPMASVTGNVTMARLHFPIDSMDLTEGGGLGTPQVVLVTSTPAGTTPTTSDYQNAFGSTALSTPINLSGWNGDIDLNAAGIAYLNQARADHLSFGLVSEWDRSQTGP